MGEALLAVLPGKGRIGSLRDPLVRTPDFFLFRLNMDTIFVDQALQAYRDKTGQTSLGVAPGLGYKSDSQRCAAAQNFPNREALSAHSRGGLCRQLSVRFVHRNSIAKAYSPS
jgi:hypothetical protein